MGIPKTWSAGDEVLASDLNSNFAYIADKNVGNGSDGDVTIASGTTNLARDMYYNNLTIQTGGIIDTKGFMIFVKGTLTQQGTGKIMSNGGAGGTGANGVNNVLPTIPSVTGTAGAGTPVGTLPASKAGAIGGLGGYGTSFGGGPVNALAGSNGTASTNSLLTGATITGGVGGSDTGAGANSGSSGTTTASLGRPWDIVGARNFAIFLSTTFSQFGGNGSNGAGGGGGYHTTTGVGGNGGGSGGNGGFIVVIANIITVNSGQTLFQVKGGAGGKGGDSNNGGGGGGGAGGNGGVVIVAYRSKSASITYDVTAGASGAIGTGTAGTPTQASGMVAGTSIEIEL